MTRVAGRPGSSAWGLGNGDGHPAHGATGRRGRLPPPPGGHDAAPAIRGRPIEHGRAAFFPPCPPRDPGCWGRAGPGGPGVAAVDGRRLPMAEQKGRRRRMRRRTLPDVEKPPRLASDRRRMRPLHGMPQGARSANSALPPSNSRLIAAAGRGGHTLAAETGKRRMEQPRPPKDTAPGEAQDFFAGPADPGRSAEPADAPAVRPAGIGAMPGPAKRGIGGALPYGPSK